MAFHNHLFNIFYDNLKDINIDNIKNKIKYTKNQIKDNTNNSFFVIFNSIPCYGFSLKITKLHKVYRTELYLSNKSCYCDELNFNKAFHFHKSDISVINEINSLNNKFYELKKNNIEWMEFRFIKLDLPNNVNINDYI